MAGLNIMNAGDRIKLHELFRMQYSKEMPSKGEVVIYVGDYGIQDDDKSILYEFFEEVFAYEIEHEDVTIIMTPDEIGATVYLIKDYNPYEYE